MIDMCMLPTLMTWSLGLDFSATGMHICAMMGGAPQGIDSNVKDAWGSMGWRALHCEL